METTPTESSPASTPMPSPVNPSGVRGTFLTVLCILTFLASGWGVIGSITSYFTADTAGAITSGAIQDAQNQMSQQDEPSFVKQLFSSIADNLTPDNIRKSSLIKLISNLCTLFGAILMWNLKKSGFYLYIAGIAILVIAPIILIGKLLGAISAISVGFFGVIFIVLYGVNLKYMNR